MSTSDVTPQRLAERARDAMYANDAAGQALGIAITAIGPGTATGTMTVRPDMVNGFGMCHGGFITTLADTVFAYACNSHNEMTVAAGLDITFLKAAQTGDQLKADAVELSRAGRLGLYDVVVRNLHGQQVALMRGRSYTVKGKAVAP